MRENLRIKSEGVGRLGCFGSNRHEDCLSLLAKLHSPELYLSFCFQKSLTEPVHLSGTGNQLFVIQFKNIISLKDFSFNTGQKLSGMIETPFLVYKIVRKNGIVLYSDVVPVKRSEGQFIL